MAFGNVVLLRTRPMRADVINVAWNKIGPAKRLEDQSDQRVALHIDASQVMGIGQHAAPQHFSIDDRAPAAGVVQPLDHKRPRPLAHDKAVAVDIKWPARLLRIHMVGKRPHVLKSGRKNRMDHLRGTRDSYITLVIPDRADRAEEIDRARRARADMGTCRPCQAKTANHCRRRGIWKPLGIPGAPRCRNEIPPTKPLGNQVGVAHVPTNKAAKPVTIDGPEPNSGIRDGFLSRLETQRDIF